MAFPVFTNGYFQIEEMIFDPAAIVPGETTKYSITIKNVSGVNVSSCYITMEMRYPNTSGGTSDLPYIYLHGAADWKMASISWAKNTSKTFTGTIVYGANNIDVSQYVVPNIGARLDIATTSIFPNMGNNDSTAMTNLTADKIFSVLNKHDNPTLSLDAVRYPDNEGEALSVSAKLNFETDLETISEHGYVISLVRRVDADGESPEEITANCTLDELYAGIDNSTTLTTDVYGNGLDWLLTLGVSNGYETASATVSIAKDFANLHLSGASTGGACFGGFSTSEDGNPKLESYYPAHFYAGINGVTNYSTEEVKTGGKWIDGKPIYTKTVLISNIKANSTSGTTTQTSIADIPFEYIWIDSGRSFCFVNGSNSYPITYVMSGGLRASMAMVQISTKTITTIVTSQYSADFYITLCYTKSTD